MATTTTINVLDEIAQERENQDRKWGEQNHPNGTGEDYDDKAAQAKTECDRATWNEHLTWDLILLEEVYEALAESDPALLRAELVQVAAVAIAWIEKIDRDERRVAPLDMLAAALAEADDDEFAQFNDTTQNLHREKAQALLTRMGAAIPTGGN